LLIQPLRGNPGQDPNGRVAYDQKEMGNPTAAR
jgi:hypothetical protein